MESDKRDSVGLLYDDFADEATRSVVESLESTITKHGMNCTFADQPGNEGRLEVSIINNIIECSKWLLILHHGGLSERQCFQCVIAMNHAMENKKLFIVHLLAPGASFRSTKGFPRIAMVGDGWIDEVVQLIGTEPGPVDQKEFCNAIHHMSLKKALEGIASMSKSDPSLGPPHTSGFIPRHLIPNACAEHVRSLIAYPSSTIDAGSQQDDVTLLIEKGKLAGTHGCEVVQVEDMASEKVPFLDEYSEQIIKNPQVNSQNQLLDRNEDLHREVAGSTGNPTPDVALLIEEDIKEEIETKGMGTRHNYTINVCESIIHYCVLVAMFCEHVFQFHSIALHIIYTLEVCYVLSYAYVICRSITSGKAVWGHLYFFISILQIAFRYHDICINSETPNCKSDIIGYNMYFQMLFEGLYLIMVVIPHGQLSGPLHMFVPLLIKGRRVYVNIVTLVCSFLLAMLLSQFVVSRAMMPLLVFAHEARIASAFSILVPNYIRLCLYCTCLIRPFNGTWSTKKQRVYPGFIVYFFLLLDAFGLVVAALAYAKCLPF